MPRTARLASFAVALAAATVAPRAARAVERPFVFANDAATPRQWTADAIYRGTYGVLSSSGAIRPIGSGALGAWGSIHDVGGELGVLPWLAVRAYGLMFLSLGDGNAYTTGGAEVRVRLVGGERQPFTLTVSGGVLREFAGAATVQGRVVATGAVGPVRITGDLCAERSFRARADGVDFIAVVGAAVQVHPMVRVGVEYVGQDFEALLDPDELEGLRHMVGPTVSAVVPRARFQVFLGTLFGLSPQSPPATVRMGLTYTIQ